MFNRNHLTVALAAALLVVPSLALAEPDQNSGPNNNGQWQQNGQWQRPHRDQGDQRDRRDRDDRDHHDNGRHNGWNNGNGNNGYYNNNNGYNNGYGYGRNGGSGYGGYGRNGNQLGGTVSSFEPFNLYLNNGTHVELHQGTVINPTGATPQPGQRVAVYGHWNSDGTFAADQINMR